MRFQKRYKDSELWREISRELVSRFFADYYDDPDALIKELEESALANAPRPSYAIYSPWAVYRALAV